MSWDRHEVGGRPLYVWAPADRSRAYPTVYVLHAHMRSAPWWFNVEPFERSYPEMIEERAPDAVVVLADGWTKLGGGQWVGPLSAYLREQVVPFVDERYSTNGLRGLQGKSSGGYGAIVHALERPDLFHAFAAHAPDALFEVTIAHGFAPAARELRDRFGGSLDRFRAAFDGITSQGDVMLLELASAADSFGDGALPFDSEGRLDETRFASWLDRDPVRFAPRHGEAVGALRGAWLDAGLRDEYFLDLGVTALRAALLQAGLPEDRLHFELFDGGHGGMSRRYPLSLDWLVGRLSMSL